MAYTGRSSGGWSRTCAEECVARRGAYECKNAREPCELSSARRRRASLWEYMTTLDDAGRRRSTTEFVRSRGTGGSPGIFRASRTLRHSPTCPATSETRCRRRRLMLLMLLMLHVDRRRRPHTRLVCEDDRMRLTYGSSDTRQKMQIGGGHS